MACRRRARRRDREHVAAGACEPAHAHVTHARYEPSGPAASLLRLHRDFGNQGVQRLVRGTLLERQSTSLASKTQTQSRGARPGAEEEAATRAHDLGRQAGKELALPAKGAGVESVEETDEDRPDPMNGGSATIKCDGAGGYEVLLGSWASATCGTKDCVVKHEESHIKDWKAKWPDGCKGQPKGYLPKGVAPDKPEITRDEYRAFLKQSECTAHVVDLDCANALKPTEACKDTVKNYIKLTADQKKNYC